MKRCADSTLSLLFVSIVIISVESQTTTDANANAIKCKETLTTLEEFRSIVGEGTVVNCRSLGITDENLYTVIRQIEGKKVIAIDLSSNHLKSIDMSVFNTFSQLKLLNLSDNGIRDISSTAQDLNPGISVVDFSWNRLTEIDKKMVPLHAWRLIFSQNQISYIVNGTFEPTKAGTHLKELDLSHNKMKSLFNVDGGILETPLLEKLNLSHNSLGSYFSDEHKLMVAFTRLTNLVILDMSYNDISRIFAADMQSLGSLQYLNLSHNELPDMDAFSFNSLTLRQKGQPYLWQHWFYRWWILTGPGLRQIRELDLSYNHIRNIDVIMIHDFSRLDKVDMSNNWYHCDGDLFFAVSLMKNNTYINTTLQYLHEPNYYVCTSPLENINKPIYQFNCTGQCAERFDYLKMQFLATHGFTDQSLSSGGNF